MAQKKLPFIKIVGDATWDYYKSLESRRKSVSLEQLAVAVQALMAQGKQFEMKVSEDESSVTVFVNTPDLLKELVSWHFNEGSVAFTKVSGSLAQAKEILLGSDKPVDGKQIRGLVNNNKKVNLAFVSGKLSKIAVAIKDAYLANEANYRPQENSIWALVTEAREAVVSHLTAKVKTMGTTAGLDDEAVEAKIAQAVSEENLGAQIGALAALVKELRSEPFNVVDPDWEPREERGPSSHSTGDFKGVSIGDRRDYNAKTKRGRGRNEQRRPRPAGGDEDDRSI